MADSKRKAPKLRFPGFNDDWEQRKLGEVAIFNPKSTLPETFEYVDLGSVVGTELINHRTENIKTAPSRAQRLAKNGDVFYQTVRPYQRNNFLFDFPYDNYVFSTGYAQMRPKIDSYFLLNRVQEERFVKQVLDRSTGTSYPAINSNDLSEIEIKIPVDNRESIQIGQLFKQIDNLITLHQRKLSDVQKLKSGLLQKMFPKNGEKVPEIRFPEFSNDWEQRKLGEVTTRVRGNDERMNLPTLTMSAGSGWLDQKDRFSGDISGKEKKNYTLLSKGELSYNHGNSKLAKYGVVFVLRNYDEALVPKVYHSFKTNEKAFGDFIEYMFATKLPDRELGKLVSSGARMDGLLNINYDDFININITIPSISEQKQISSLFRQLDDLITLHQRKLEHLQQQKKALLQQMFI